MVEEKLTTDMSAAGLNSNKRGPSSIINNRQSEMIGSADHNLQFGQSKDFSQNEQNNNSAAADMLQMGAMDFDDQDSQENQRNDVNYVGEESEVVIADGVNLQ